MFFLIFEATPRVTTTESKAVGGAFVSCWIQRPTEAEAQEAARVMISEMGWIVGEADKIRRVDDSHYEAGNPARQYFDQAKTDGEVLVFHKYPDRE